ncbi:hypothetical protein OCU04_012111 [Sclerotinia nivalis]|uniref:Uncharacterized protein n=1 Tax=Sclerotinia nivalis TaxID=352851 RepID=A0A9X0AAC8_9HELO|nr:hypothetical protein OCU04_012111 [Sclerotinia nivalis]
MTMASESNYKRVQLLFPSSQTSRQYHNTPTYIYTAHIQTSTQHLHTNHRLSAPPSHHIYLPTIHTIEQRSAMDKMKSKEVLCKGQPQSQPAKAEPNAERKTEPKANSAASKEETAKTEQKEPASSSKKEMDTCPRCEATAFFGACYSCSYNTGVGL